MADKDVVDIETGPETLNYRAARLKNWQSIIDDYRDYYNDALEHGASDLQARAAAAAHARGSVRWIVGESLTHAPASEAAKFIQAAPRSWGNASELLLAADAGVPELIERTYPHTDWATKLDVLTEATAKDDQTWTEWVTEAAGALGIPQATKQIFGAVGDVASGIGAAAKGTGEGLGGAVAGVGAGVAGLGQGIGGALRYIPIAVIALGAVGVYAFYRYIMPAPRVATLPREPEIKALAGERRRVNGDACKKKN